eukprot:m.358162 g.358162  ORF g.358162 m.358162 type:complete len:1114 (+) comp19945_c1_seq18:3867-7208(+)
MVPDEEPPTAVSEQVSGLRAISRMFWEQVFRLSYGHGLLCASNPFATLIGVLTTIIVISIPGFHVLFQAAPATRTVWHDGHGDPPAWLQSQQPICRVQQISLINAEAGDPLCPEFVSQAGFVWPEFLTSFRTDIDGREVKLSSFCPPGGCSVVSASPFLGFNHTRAKHGSVRNILSGQTSAHLVSGKSASRDLVFPGFTSAGPLSTADAVAVTVAFAGTSTPEGRAMERIFLTKALEAFGATVLSGGSEQPTPALDSNAYILYEPRRRKIAEQTTLMLSYALVFLYIYVTVDKFQLVKSKIGLGCAAVIIVFGSMTMSVSICSVLGLVTQLTAVEVVPFLIMAIGLDNMINITKSVVSTSPHLAVRFRVAEGLALAAPSLLKSLASMECLLLLGVYSKIEELQEFCLVACVGIFCDFFLQIVFYVTVLGVDVRRMELSDLAQPHMGTLGNRRTKPLNPLSEQAHSVLRQQDGAMVAVLPKSLVVVLFMVFTISVPIFGGASVQPTSTLAALQKPNPHADYGVFLEGTVVDETHAAHLRLLPSIVAKMGVGACELPATSPAPSTLANQLGKLHVLRSVFRQPTVVVAVCLGIMAIGFATFFAITRLRQTLFGNREGADMVATFTMAHFDVTTLSGHRQDIECLQTCAGSGIIASACLGGQVRVWDMSTQSCLAVLRCANDDQEHTMQTAPWSLALHSQLVAVGCANGNVEVWDVETRGCALLRLPRTDALGEAERPAPKGGITCLMFVNSALYTASSTGVVEMWAWEAPSPATQPTTMLVRSESSLSLGGTAYNFIGDDHGTAHPERRSASPVIVPQNVSPQAHKRGHRRVLSGDAGVSSWAQPAALARRSIDRTELAIRRSSSASVSLTELAGEPGNLPPNDQEKSPPYKCFYCVASTTCHKAAINAMQRSDRHLVTASADRVIKAFDLTTLVCVHTMHGHEDSITSLQVLPDGTAVTSSADCTVRLWDTAAGLCSHIFRGHSDRVLRARVNASLVVSSAEDDTMRVWSRATGRCLLVLNMSEAHVDFALHERSVLVTACDGKLTAWDLVGGGERLRTVPLMSEVVPAGLQALPGSMCTNTLLLEDDTIVCDLGRLVKFVQLPFPHEQRTKMQ